MNVSHLGFRFGRWKIALENIQFKLASQNCAKQMIEVPIYVILMNLQLNFINGIVKRFA